MTTLTIGNMPDYLVEAPDTAVPIAADIELTNAGVPFNSLSVSLPEGGGELGILTGGTGVSFPEGMGLGKPVWVDGVPIGTLSSADPDYIEFTFNTSATSTLVQKLIRALTYTDRSGESGFTESSKIRFILDDVGEGKFETDILIGDKVTGTGGADTFSVDKTRLTIGDELDGGAGDDVLELTGGDEFLLYTMSKLAGIETIQGSAENDIIIMAGSQLADVKVIRGGGAAAEDVLALMGTEIDLSGKSIIGFSAIRLHSDGAVVTVDNAAIAKLVKGYDTQNDSLTVVNGALTEAERLALHRQGLETIIARDVEGGEYRISTHDAPKLSRFDGDHVNSVIGGTVFIDANRNAVLEVDSGLLRSLSVELLGTSDAGESIGFATSARLTLEAGSGSIRYITYDSKTIGEIEGLGTQSLSFSFNDNASPAIVQEIIRALTYSRSDGTVAEPRRIELSLTDVGWRETKAEVTVHPPAKAALTAGVDSIDGTSADEIFLGEGRNFTQGDRIDGGGGSDTLQLSSNGAATEYHLEYLAELTGIETVNATMDDDIVIIGSDQIAGVWTLDGGRGNDTLHLAGRTFDMTGKTVTGFEKIVLSQNVEKITVDNLAVAQLIEGFQSQDDHLVITGENLSDAEREAYFLRGIDRITDGNNRTTSNLAPQVSGFLDEAVSGSAGKVVLLDAGRNAALSPEDTDLHFMQFAALDAARLDRNFHLDIQTGGGIGLGSGTKPGSIISVDGVDVGKIAATSDQWNLKIEFLGATDPALVQKLIQAIAYRNSSGDPNLIAHHKIGFYIEDKGKRYFETNIDVTTVPDTYRFLTDKVESVSGSGADDVFAAPIGSINADDTLDGGEGTDTLEVAAGMSDLTQFAVLTGIEILKGSPGDDVIVAEPDQLSGIISLQGGHGRDELRLKGADYDFRGKSIAGFETILFQDNGSLTTADKATALLAKAAVGKTVSIVLEGTAFTVAERSQLFRQGIKTIKDATGTYTNAAPEDLALDPLVADELAATDTVVGTLSTIDPNSDESFTYELLDDAGGRFKLDASRTKVLVNNGLLLDFEQSGSHVIRLRVTDKAGASFEKYFIIDVRDVLAENAVGSGLNDVFVGGAGHDTFYGGAGNDTLKGSYGNDLLKGDSGKDVFVFHAPLHKSNNVDRILDFNVKDDTIQLENAIFKKLKKAGTLSKSFFTIGTKAKDKNDYIIYNNKKGVLYYDEDGSGKKKAVEIAKLSKKLKMTHKDFFII